MPAVSATAQALAGDAHRVSRWDGFPFLSFWSSSPSPGLESRACGFTRGPISRPAWALAQGPEAKTRVIEQSGIRAAHGPRPPGREESARIARAGNPVFPAAKWAPVGYGMAKLVGVDGHRRDPPLAPEHLWWLHALMAFGFIVAVPFTKAFHLISSPVNIFMRGQDPPGRLQVAVESGVRRCAI